MSTAAAASAAADHAGRFFAKPEVMHERRPDGAIIMRSARALAAVPRALGVWLERWAVAEPHRAFLAERDGAGGWRRTSYAQAALLPARRARQAGGAGQKPAPGGDPRRGDRDRLRPREPSMDAISHAQTITDEDAWPPGGAPARFAENQGTLRELSATDLGLKAAGAPLKATSLAQNLAEKEIDAVAASPAPTSFDVLFLARHPGINAGVPIGATSVSAIGPRAAMRRTAGAPARSAAPAIAAAMAAPAHQFPLRCRD
jgi:hypothetical protein